MATANKIQIGTIWLTSDGTTNGIACQTRTSGLDALKPTRAAKVHRALDGTPYRQSKTLKGKTIEIAFPDTIKKEVFDAVFEFIDDAEIGNTSFDLSIEGDTGNFDLTVIPDENWLRFPGEFVDGWILGATFAFVTT